MTQKHSKQPNVLLRQLVAQTFMFSESARDSGKSNILHNDYVFLDFNTEIPIQTENSNMYVTGRLYSKISLLL